VLCGDAIERACGHEIAAAAADLFGSMSVVRDARIAVAVGVRERGVTAMHDATERGVWGGLVEIAGSAGTGLVVDRAAIPLRPESRAVCRLFDIDPYSTSSEGTLLLTCVPAVAETILHRLHTEGIDAALIGELTSPDEGIRVVEAGRERELTAPAIDPFWTALMRALGEDAGGKAE